MGKEDIDVDMNENSREENESLSETEGDTEPEIESDEQDQIQRQPDPQFAVFQKVLAKDNTTPLLYEAIIRKLVYAPKSNKVNIYLLDPSEKPPDNDDLDTICGQEKIYTWHYFVHYIGWKATWDRWIEEDQIFPDSDDTRILAKRLKDESKCLKKNSGRKKTLEVMQRIVRLEQELRDKQARGECIDVSENAARDSEKVNANDQKATNHNENDIESNKKMKAKESINKNFLKREVALRGQDLTSRNCSINLPFPLKKILTDDWEVITKCDMLHHLPASVTVMDALNAYYEGKIQVFNASSNSPTLGMHEVLPPTMGREEEKKDEEMKDEVSIEPGENLDADLVAGDNCNSGDEEAIKRRKNQLEWKEMVDGICLFFDQALSKRLLFRHEMPQCLIVEETYEKRYCEIYPCEFLIRMCIKLPDVLEDDKSIPEEEKSRILFKIGDLLRFLNRYQDEYFLQKYRKATPEESAKAMSLKKRLGLKSDEEEESANDVSSAIGDDESLETGKGGKNNRKRASTSKSMSQRRRSS